MNGAVTFFRNREQDTGKTYNLELTMPGGTVLFQIYSRAPADSYILRERKLEKDEDLILVLKDLRELIKNVGGGLITLMHETQECQSIEIYPVESESYYLPEHVLVLQPGYSPKKCPVTPEKFQLDLAAGSHIVLPVDKQASEHLDRFLEYLHWYSSDLESLVLNAIRRPSLDVRVERLDDRVKRLEDERAMEKNVEVPPSISTEAPQTDEQASLSQGLLVKIMRQIRIILIGLLLAIAGVAVVGWFVYRLTLPTPSTLEAPQTAPATPTTPEKTQTAPATPTTPEKTQTAPDTPITPEKTQTAPATPITPEKTQTAPDTKQTSVDTLPIPDAPKTIPDLGIGQLINIIKDEQRRSADEHLAKLWNSHFSKIDDLSNADRWDQEKILDLFNKKEFLWGVLKLQLLSLDPDIKDYSFLDRVDYYSATRDLLRKVPEDKYDNSISDMFAVLACYIEHKNDNKPIIGANEESSNFIIKPDTSCDSFKDQVIAMPGIKQLSQSIEKRLKASEGKDQK